MQFDSIHESPQMVSFNVSESIFLKFRRTYSQFKHFLKNVYEILFSYGPPVKMLWCRRCGSGLGSSHICQATRNQSALERLSRHLRLCTMVFPKARFLALTSSQSTIRCCRPLHAANRLMLINSRMTQAHPFQLDGSQIRPPALSALSTWASFAETWSHQLPRVQYMPWFYPESLTATLHFPAFPPSSQITCRGLSIRLLGSSSEYVHSSGSRLLGELIINQLYMQTAAIVDVKTVHCRPMFNCPAPLYLSTRLRTYKTNCIRQRICQNRF